MCDEIVFSITKSLGFSWFFIIVTEFCTFSWIRSYVFCYVCELTLTTPFTDRGRCMRPWWPTQTSSTGSLIHWFQHSWTNNQGNTLVFSLAETKNNISRTLAMETLWIIFSEHVDLIRKKRDSDLTPSSSWPECEFYCLVFAKGVLTFLERECKTGLASNLH